VIKIIRVGNAHPPALEWVQDDNREDPSRSLP